MTEPHTSRRALLTFLGRGAAAIALSPALLTSGCKKRRTPLQTDKALNAAKLPFKALPPHYDDTLAMAEGFSYNILARWGDTINAKGDPFGYNNDFTAFLPSKDPHQGWLWVNHESPHRYFVGQANPTDKATAVHIERERQAVGGSLVWIKQDPKSNTWHVDKSHANNRRYHARTPIALEAARPIAGRRVAAGTLANCCGGKTPWGTFLTCEENYDEFYGEAVITKGKRTINTRWSKHGWQKFFPEPPEHYGWVVEINPATGAARKLTALGRFAHEGAAVVKTKDGRCVVYMGDDRANQCLYKFVAARPESLAEGELFVADITKGVWQSLDLRKQKVLQSRFKDQTDVLIHAREAARLVGGSPLARPEGVQVDPLTQAVYVCQTKNPRAGNYFGSILKLENKDEDHLATQLTASNFLAGGTTSGFACPDNIAFDPAGNLWMTNDISGSQLGKGRYRPFGHNSLHCIPLRGKYAGQVIRVASGPVDAELTGISFTPDGKTMFLSVQHPGAGSTDAMNITSHWPKGGDHTPTPAVIAISGPSLDLLQKTV